MTIAWLPLTPALAPALGAIAVLILDLFPTPRRWLPHAVGVAATSLGLLAALLVSRRNERTSLCSSVGGGCFVDFTGPALGLAVALLLCGLIVTLLLWPTAKPSGIDGAVPVVLVLTSVTGGVSLSAASDLGTWLICLELATLPLVALVATNGTIEAARGALTYVVTAVLSFSLLALSAALWVVTTGSGRFSGAAVVEAWAEPSRRPAFTLAVLLALAGLGFKVAAVPFHTWTPTTYACAPTAVAAALSSVSKLAAVAGLVVLVRPLVQASESGVQVHAAALALGALAIVSMTAGNVIALRQDDVVRLIAWSAIAQGGWLLLGLAALNQAGLAATSAYGIAYAVGSLAVLCVVAVVSGAGSQTRELSAYEGLFQRHRPAAFALTLGLLSLAGLPPALLGLVAKVAVVAPVLQADLWWLAILAGLNVVLGLAVYLRWIRVLLRPSPIGAPKVDADDVRGIALGLSTAILVGLSVLPNLVLALVGG